MKTRSIATHAAAFACALCVLGVIGTLWWYSQPTEEEMAEAAAERPYQQMVGFYQAQDADRVATMLEERAAQEGNPVALVMAASDISPVEGVSSHPAVIFGSQNLGMDVVMLGNANFRSLWQAISLGSYDPERVPRNVVLVIQMRPFMTSADTASSFCDVFSPLSYDRFMANPSLSENLKVAVTERALSYFNQAQEKKQASKGASAEAEPLPAITELPLRNDSLAEELFSLDVIEQTITSYGPTRATAIPDELLGTDPAIPDWDELLGAARIEAAEMSSSNALGIADKAYRESYGKWVSSALAGWNLYGSAAERGFRSGEWDDYELLLDVCEELGLEPLVVIAPVKGAAYDATYYDEEARAAFYEGAASVAESYGFPVADLTAYEYDPTFSSNVDDIGWTGWVRLCQSIYDYVVGESE